MPVVAYLHPSLPQQALIGSKAERSDKETCSRIASSAIVVAAVRAHDRHRGDVTAQRGYTTSHEVARVSGA